MSLLNKINKYGGIYLFKDANNLKFSLFNYLYNKKIINLKHADEEIAFFHENGFLKPKINFKDEIDELKLNLDDKDVTKRNDFTFKYNLNTNAKKIIKKILNTENFLKLKKKIENYYNLKMYLINASVRRNFSLNVDNDHKIKYYSNNFHVDYYLINYFKIFINIHDVDENKGPLELFSKKNSKKFVKKGNYKDRNNYSLEAIRECNLIKNTGKTGDLFVCSTPQCMHRASSPKNGNFRDMLFLTFAVTTEVDNNLGGIFSFEKDFEKEIWTTSETLNDKLCKPKSFKKQLNLLKKFYNSKIS
jgi:hypothetical protein